MMISYPDRLNLAQAPTPLYRLDRLTQQLRNEGVECPQLWIKRDDQTGNLTSGNKVRKLEFLLAAARAQGCDTLITSGGVQSNHCRAVAVLGAQLGFKVHLLLRSDIEPAPVGNLLIDQLVGANISHYSPQAFKRLDQLFAQWQQYYAERGSKAYSIPTGGSNGTGLWGYIAAAEELQQDFQREGISPDYIVHATGSGGTQAGLTLGCSLLGMETQVEGYAVCDDSAYFSQRVTEDIQEWAAQNPMAADIHQLSILTQDQYAGPKYGEAGPEVFAAIKHLAALEGVILDPVYTGKAFYGMVEEIRKGRYAGVSDMVFVHTGGLLGLLAQQHRLNE
ncbi:MAG: 1-aminocyclopropane-1-carboxylate deaminase/D-cysteine desulfhydrase [Porticoccaceae bacterium]